MKIFSVAVAVALVLTFIWIEESSAVPVTEVQELEEPMINGNPDATHEEMPVDSWTMPYVRQKRGIVPDDYTKYNPYMYWCKVFCKYCPQLCRLCCPF